MAKLGLFGKLCIAAGVCAAAAGTYAYCKRQDEQHQEYQKQVSQIIEATNVESALEKALAEKKELEQKARESLKKTLDCIGITKDGDIDYFHQVMQEESGRILFKSYVTQPFTEQNKASKEGFEAYCKKLYTIMQTPKELRNKVRELNDRQKANYEEIDRIRSMSPQEFRTYQKEKESK